MAKSKKSWLARLDEIDQKDQARLDREDKTGAGTIFRKLKPRTGKIAEQEKTLKLTVFVYGFFILEAFILGGLLLGSSTSSEYGSGIRSVISLIFWSAILSVSSVIIGIVALKMRPRLFYIHIPFILNCILLCLAFIIFAF